MLAVVHRRIALSALLIFASGVGCAHHRACGGGCGVEMGYGGVSPYGCDDCDMEPPRARHPFDHLRHAFRSGGCGEVYWGEWPDRSLTCDDCNRAPGVAHRGAFWHNLWGVRHDMTHTAHHAEVGCDTCGDAAMDFEGEVIFDGPADAESIETPTPTPAEPKPPRNLPGPENDSAPSIQANPTSARTSSRPNTGNSPRSIVRPSRTSPARN